MAKPHYAVNINPGDKIHTVSEGKLQTLRVLDLVDVPEEDSPYDGLLRVEAA